MGRGTTSRDASVQRVARLAAGAYPNFERGKQVFLGAILDYQIPAATAWENARRLSEVILHDPGRLWDEITNQSLPVWQSKRGEYKSHRFPHGHDRVWMIGKRIVDEYAGDVRRIWEGQTVDVT